MSPAPVPGGDPTRTRAGGGALLAPGARLAGRYRVVELLGAGGMGLVYRAVDEKLDLEVALKVLRPEHAAQAGMLERFRQELVLARQVTHPHVVRIHDIGEDGDVLFLSMDLVRGRSLREVLREEGRLDPGRAVEIGGQLAEALAAAHGKGVVHRDLKPENVLVAADGTAAITDFGVARSLAGAGLTRTGGVVGTVEYLSPEQARGEEVDARSDLYALGLVLYETLAGEPPFRGATWTEVLGQRLTGTPRDLAAVRPEVPAWLARVVHRCLERRPEDRYPDAAALARDLAAGRAPGRRLPRLLPRGRTARRMAWTIAALAALALAAFALWRGTAGGGAAAAPVRHAVAVLPLIDETGAAELGWVAAGGAELLAAALADSPALAVVDSERVFRTLDDLGLEGRLSEADQRLAAELLGADRLVTGRVRRPAAAAAAGDVWIDARLVAVGPEGQEERSFRGAGDGILAALEALAAELRTALEVPPPAPGERPLPADVPPEVLAAYGEGVEALWRGDSVAAAPALERAVGAAPGFAAAWVRLAAAYGDLGYDERAVEAARRAVELLPEPAGRLGFEARATLAALSGDFERARQITADLVARYPEDVEARVDLGEALGDEGRLDEARRELLRAVEHDPHHPRAWFLLGKHAILDGDYRRAIDDYLVRALVVQNRLGNRQGQADAANALGIAHLNLGELDQAVPHLERAAALRRAIGDLRGTAATLNNLGLVEAQRGDSAAARASFEESLAIRQEIGDREGVANVHNHFGFLEEEQGSYREALAQYRRALELRRDTGDPRALAESTNNVGYAYYLLGEYDNAGVYWERASRLSEDSGNREGTIVARQSLALLHIARGRWDAALAALLASLEESRALGLAHAEAVALGNLGRVAEHQGRFGAALSSYDQAVAKLAAIEDPRGLAEYHLMATDALVELGRTDAAAERLAEARRWLAAGGNREQEAEAARLAGELGLARGDAAAARRAFQDAADGAETSGGAVALLAARLGLARAELAAGRPRPAADGARQVLARAEAIGHAPLRLQALEALAAAELAADDFAAAAATAGRALAAARDHRPWGRAWRLHHLQAEALAGRGDAAAAAEQYAAAARELARLRADLDGADRQAFDRRPEVREIDARAASTPRAA
ncbi:MAG TPA: serine/threonine-protein kinase [Thermoanaerobaculia bacterium]